MSMTRLMLSLPSYPTECHTGYLGMWTEGTNTVSHRTATNAPVNALLLLLQPISCTKPYSPESETPAKDMGYRHWDLDLCTKKGNQRSFGRV